MSEKIELRRFGKGVKQAGKTKAKGYFAVMGKLDGTVLTGVGNRVYVTSLSDGLPREVLNRRNVPNRAGLVVFVGSDEYSANRIEVLFELGSDGSSNNGVTSSNPAIPPHNHSWPGLNTTWVHGQQFLPLLAKPIAGTLTIQIYPGVVRNSTLDGWVFIGDQVVDVSGDMPASDALWITLQANDDGSVDYVVGSTNVTRASLDEGDIPEATTGKAIWAVVLEAGYNELFQNTVRNDFLDLRFDKGGVGAVDVFYITYTPTDLGDWDYGSDPGSAGDALDQLADRVTSLEVFGLDISGGVDGGNPSARGTGVFLSGSRVTIVDDSDYNSFPGVVELTDGTLLVVYRDATNHATSKGVLKKRTSSDQGVTWSAEATVYSDATWDVRDPQITRLTGGRLIVSFMKYNQAGSALNDGSYVIISDDDGSTWGTPINVTDDFTGPSKTTAAVVELANGNLVLPIYGNDTGDTYESARLSYSTDNGNTWTPLSIIAESASRHYQEPNIALLPNGRLICMLRSDTPSQLDGHYYQSFSYDNGLTWETPVDQFEATGRPAIKLLPNNALMLPYRKNSDDSYDVAYRISTNYGESWGSEVTLDSTGTYEYAAITPVDVGYIGMVYGVELSSTNSDLFFQKFLLTEEKGQLTVIDPILGYIPAVLSDWDYLDDPGDYKDAIDQLAARVKDLELVGGGGGGTPSIELIASETLSGTSAFAVVTIPSGYDEIWIVGKRIRSSYAGTADVAALRVGNGSIDTGNNYAYICHREGSSSSNDTSAAATYFGGVIVPGNTASAGYFGTFLAKIFDADGTIYNKTVDYRGSNPDAAAERESSGGGLWLSTSAIDRIQLIAVTSGSFIAGSQLDVLGVIYG